MKNNIVIIFILFTIIISCNPALIDPKLTINISPVDTGNVVMKVDQFKYTLVALPEKGYMFSNWSEGASGSNNPYSFVLDFDKNITANFVQTMYDDFEENNGSFSTIHDWDIGGDVPPVVQQDNAYDGNWGVKFGDIDNNQNSYFEILTEYDKSIPLSFMYKTSSEEGFDVFEFSVNGNIWLSASGDNDWKLYESTNMLPKGKNILRWEYKKDSITSYGDDTVYIDGIGISEATNTMLNINWTIPKGAEPILLEIDDQSYKHRNNINIMPDYTENQLNDINMNSIIVRFREGISIRNSNNEILDKYKKYGVVTYNPINPKFNIATVTPLDKVKVNWKEMLDFYNSMPEVEYAEPNPNITGQEFVPDDPDFSLQWNMNLLNMQEVWETTLGNSNVTVAVLDSGVTPGLSDSPINIDTANDYDFVNNDNDANDDYHGTHVAGTIAQATNNGIGVTGMAPNVKLYYR